MNRRRRPPPIHRSFDPALLGAAEVASFVDQACSGIAALASPARSVLARARPAVVVAVAKSRVEREVDRLVRTGWMPGELAWAAGRRSAAVAEAGLWALADHLQSLAPVSLHPAWEAHLAEVGLSDAESVARGAEHWRGFVASSEGAVTLVRLAEALAALGPVEILAPVPGHPEVLVAGAAGGLDGNSGIDAKVLKKVRALLAKAESTTFENEAQALTAKAHELMTRHSLEHAAVASPSAESSDRPSVRRFCLDDPYAESKATLLAVLAECCRCRAVLHGGVPMVTVVGFGPDLAAVDVLLTSLLVQAQTSLEEVGRSAVAGSRERSRGFRSSFLRGFALRIGERLRAASEATVADVHRSSGGALVPVLARREEAVATEVEILHPRLRTKVVSGPTDALGWQAGQQAAEQADLPWSRLGQGSA